MATDPTVSAHVISGAGVTVWSSQLHKRNRGSRLCGSLWELCYLLGTPDLDLMGLGTERTQSGSSCLLSCNMESAHSCTTSGQVGHCCRDIPEVPQMWPEGNGSMPIDTWVWVSLEVSFILMVLASSESWPDISRLPLLSHLFCDLLVPNMEEDQSHDLTCRILFNRILSRLMLTFVTGLQ